MNQNKPINDIYEADYTGFYDYDGLLPGYDNESYHGADLPRTAANKATETACNHDWTEYVGLLESYTYCKSCDMKKE